MFLGVARNGTNRPALRRAMRLFPKRAPRAFYMLPQQLEPKPLNDTKALNLSWAQYFTPRQTVSGGLFGLEPDQHTTRPLQLHSDEYR
jgi:hypothetical protein